ncbi:conjugal transfer protein TraF [Lactobacillus sp. CC-MHH1034]|uniref:PedC/BrcD family bacteriocin maturation disulfide isomerase n=1 Tax=Agrilactobacillus fermenti TaxID=2586909 RepID=UPI001E2BCA14|nr:PedC/BrcD family bacteriocin maturation disulfide isomerase [Agrilactobacillus fermenti]MCD2255761.1 conjugal transfer protein TraF [Agrilactobacillus fermenti]
MNKRKSIFIISLIVIIFTLNLGSVSRTSAATSGESDVTKVTQEQYADNLHGIYSLNGNELNNLISSNTDYFLFIGYKECPYCREFSTTLNQFKYQSKLPIYYVNLDDQILNGVTPDTAQKIEKFIYGQVKLDSTPTIVKVSNGQATNILVGSDTSIQDLENINQGSQSYLYWNYKFGLL